MCEDFEGQFLAKARLGSKEEMILWHSMDSTWVGDSLGTYNRIGSRFYVSRTHQDLHQTPNSYGGVIYCQLNRTNCVKRRKHRLKMIKNRNAPNNSARIEEETTINSQGNNEPQLSWKWTKMPNQKEAKHVLGISYEYGDERKKNLWRWLLWFDDHVT